MNPLQTFGNNVIQGAKMVNPGSVLRGAKKLGGDMLGEAKNELSSVFSKKKGMATKMTAPPAPLKPTTPQYNQGFNGYKSYLDQANNY